MYGDSQQLFQKLIVYLTCMKKLIAFIWLVIYTCVSTGFVVSTHYCMNKQRSIELGAAQKEICDKCGMVKKESHGCCRDEVKVVKLQQDTQLAKIVTPSLELSLPVITASQHLIAPFYNFTESSEPASFQPPPLQPDDLCVANSVFRI